MASLLKSEAAFRERAAECGLNQTEIDRLQAFARVGVPVQRIPRNRRAAQAATARAKSWVRDKPASACQLPQSAQSSGESTIPSGARVL